MIETLYKLCFKNYVANTNLFEEFPVNFERLLAHCACHSIINLKAWLLYMGDVQDFARSQTYNVVWERITHLESNELESTECLGFSDVVPVEV